MKTTTLVAALLVFAMATSALADDCPEYDHIIDDQHGAPQFTLTGNDWATWGSNGCGYSSADSSFHYTSKTVGGPDKKGTATWTPNLPVAGTYEITTHWRKTGNRTTDANHFIYDGEGGITEIIIDQKQDASENGDFECKSGWWPLGTYYCQSGKGGCYVVLDANDDDYSDEANAVRFTLVDCTGEPDPVEPDPVETCDFPGEGQHEVKKYADKVTGTGWESMGMAKGPEDGQEAFSPNVEEGEILQAEFPDFCDPDGDETIDKVEVGVKLRTQYDSGKYDVILKFHAQGTATMTTHHTNSKWDVLDLTGEKDWTWSDLNNVTAVLELHSHPGGAIDSDAWVDAFYLNVVYTTTGAGADCVEGEKQCVDDTVEECKDGQWVWVETCEWGCDNGPCLLGPGPGVETEPDVWTGPSPDAGGPAPDVFYPTVDTAAPGDSQWDTVSAPEGCSPNVLRCSAAGEVVEICSLDGTYWAHYQTCADAEVCINGQCQTIAAGKPVGCSSAPDASESKFPIAWAALLAGLALILNRKRKGVS